MAFKFIDRAQMSISGAPGTGPISLGSPLFGYQSLYGFNGLSSGDTFRYLAVDPSGAWEVGIGTYSSTGNIVTRSPTKSSAAANAAITLSSNAVIGCTFAAEDIATGRLDALGDVNVTEGAGIDGYVLTWDNTSGKWIADAPTTGSSLAGLSDVTLTSPSNNQVLAYNTGATKWENLSLASVALSGAYSALTGSPTIPTNASFDLSSLGDVTITSLADTQVLAWNAGASKWENVNQSGGGGGSGTVTTVANNGTNVDTAAVTLNFVNATSITTSAHDVTITLPTGGGGGGGVGTVGTPPTFVQFDSGSWASSNAATVTMGSAPVNGNMLCAIVWATGSPSPSANTGWTLEILNGDGNYWLAAFTKVAGAGESTAQTPTNGTSGQATVGIWEMSGQNVTTPKVAIIANYESANSRIAFIPAIPQTPGTFFCGSIAVYTASDTLSMVHGCATVDANLTSAPGAPAAFGHSDSNSFAYTMIGLQSALVPFNFAYAIFTS